MTGASSTATVYVRNAATTITVMWGQANIPAGQSFVKEGLIMLNGGDQVVLTAAIGSPYWLSGALLPAPVTVTALPVT